MEEIWKKIENYDYVVSNTGKIQRLYDGVRTGIDLGSLCARTGIYKVNMSNGGKDKMTCGIQVIVWKYFGDEPQTCKFIKHRDNDKKNNAIDNLYQTNFVRNGFKKEKPEKVKKIKVVKPVKVKPVKVKPVKVLKEQEKKIDRSVKKEYNSNGRYLENRDLEYQLRLSYGLGKRTPKLDRYLINITEGVFYRLSATYSYEYKQDILQDALLQVLRKWNKFDLDKYENPLAFFTEIAKRALAGSLNSNQYKTEKLNNLEEKAYWCRIEDQYFRY